jgi:glutamate synthase domain-containing protein 3
MSGGLAYVYDEDGRFRDMCNMQMIEVETLTEDDRDRIKSLLERHVARTESAKGRALLQGFFGAASRFVKVVPTEYKKVLAARRAREEAPAKVERVEVARG